MAQTLQTPGVYIIEKNAFPNSVVPVATAIPAFIGYTEKTTSTSSKGQDLTGVPTEITSLKQFEDYFGKEFKQTFTVTASTTAPAASSLVSSVVPSLPPFPVVQSVVAGTLNYYTIAPAVSTTAGYFSLYRAIQLFYANGGGTCYIVSQGPYGDIATPPPTPFTTLDALAALELEPNPTMVLCPDALTLQNEANYATTMQQMLAHCNTMQSRVAVFDVYGGASWTSGVDPSTGATSPIAQFRNDVGQNYLNYGIAYFPWVNTTIVSPTEVNFLYLDAQSLSDLKTSLDSGGNVLVPEWGANPPATQDIFAEATALQGYVSAPSTLPAIPNVLNSAANLSTEQVAALLKQAIQSVNGALQTNFPLYSLITAAITNYLNTLPVAPAMAGVITAIDNNVGVWEAPANYSLNAVMSPTVSLNDALQADMNVDAATGKSVNAIRAFRGLGTLVWGARTLDGNSQDWRYVNVRRTMIFIEQSVKLAARAYVFQPNDANTWSTVKSMISTFLFNIWKQGALQGVAPADAYSVAVGLGSTMTPDDILDGIMNVTVLVAIVHPAEFIQLTFQQQMAKS